MTTSPLSPEQEALKAAYIAARGYWNDWTEGLLRFSPEFLQRYAAYGAYPAANGPLSPAMVELVYVALDASATHLFEPGLRLHARMALDRGASIGQVIAAIQLGAAQGLEGTYRGVTALAEEMDAAGIALPAPQAGDTPLHHEFEARFGNWPEHCALLHRMDPGYVRVMLDMLTASPAGTRPLRPGRSAAGHRPRRLLHRP